MQPCMINIWFAGLWVTVARTLACVFTASIVLTETTGCVQWFLMFQYGLVDTEPRESVELTRLTTSVMLTDDDGLLL